MSAPIDLGAYREQRRALAEQAQVGMRPYTDLLTRFARDAADVAWVLGTPVRGLDDDLKRAVYRLVLRRLQRQSDRALKGSPVEAALKPQARSLIEDGFRVRLWELESAASTVKSGGAA